MNIPVYWPTTVTVSTRNLVAIMLFLNDHGFEPDMTGFRLTEVRRMGETADEACCAYDPLCNVLDAKCPGWL